jgi:hypothetical protein
MFRATKGSGVTITTILRNDAIETRPGNKIHHLREKRSACVHRAPDWKTKIGEDVTSRILDRVQGATKKNASETPVLQRYVEIVPSVNRTAVIEADTQQPGRYAPLMLRHHGVDRPGGELGLPVHDDVGHLSELSQLQVDVCQSWTPYQVGFGVPACSCWMTAASICRGSAAERVAD